jgi:TonB-linked SusC/RagA family outer membrane protein
MQHFGVCKKRAFGIPMPLPGLLNDKYRQAVRIMKITAFILLVCFLQVSAKVPAQEKITIKEKGASLDKIFTQINKQTGYNFLFTNEDLRNAKPVDIEVKNASLKEVLDLLFKKQDLTYVISEKIITILPKKNDQPSKDGSAFPPPIDIHGKVVDENGKPVPSVTVTVKGTKKQTITNENGEFSISEVSDNGVLVFSSVNMEAFEINVSGQKDVLARLKTKTSELDEVQIIAYGQTTKRLQTGNVTTVKGEDIQRQPVNNPLLALAGRVPGLFIKQSTGLPGSGITIKIEGQNSILNGNLPLYVIDGVPYPSQLLTSLNLITGRSEGVAPDVANVAGNPLSFINPADIESIEVLKDADATAIYGSRAANGAILITTIKGKAGQTKVDVDFQNGWGTVQRKLDLLNTAQYLEMRHESKTNFNAAISPTDYDINGAWDTTRYDNWQKALIGGTAQYMNVNARVSGGNALTQFMVATTYHRETTVFPGDFKDQKGSVYFNLNNTSSNQKFRLQLSGSYLVDNNQLMSRDLTRDAINLAPVAPSLYKDDGSLNWARIPSGADSISTWINPLAYLNNKSNTKTNNLVSNLAIDYQILQGLYIKSSFGYTNMQGNETLIFPLTSTRPELRPSTLRRAQFNHSSIGSWIIEPQVNYKLAVGKGKLDALLGTTLQQNNAGQQMMEGTDYVSDEVLLDIGSAVNKNATSYSSTYKYTALFGRINFNWLDKYIFNFTTRRDGSSRFGSNNRFHNFGSIASAWIFSQEKLVQKKLAFLSFGKLRASYGLTGNDQIGDYQFLNQYSSTYADVPYQGAVGLVPNGLPNPYLEWEETRKLQFGVDLGLWKDRIMLNVNYYNNRSSNQLLSYTLPIVTGFPSITRNFPAIIKNFGWELAMTVTPISKRDFRWTNTINVTIPKNKLVDFPDLASSSYASRLIVGEPITINKVFQFAGTNPTTGIYQFMDSAKNLTSSPVFGIDQTVIINTAPKFYGGFQSNFRYNSFEVDFLFQFVKQIGQNYFSNNTTTLPGAFNGALNKGNQPVYVLGRWQKVGDISSVQKFGNTSNFDLVLPLLYTSGSDHAFSDASFIRLKNLAVSWQLPVQWKQKLHLQNAKIYMQGQNLFTITNYKGLDPETLSSVSLPPLRIMTIGIQIGL